MNLSGGHDLSNFYAKLKDKKSGKVLNDLHSFINNTFQGMTQKTKDVEEVALIVQDFIYKKVNEFAKLWEYDFTHSRFSYIQVCEGFEALITKSLYYQIFNLIPFDRNFNKLKAKYSFVSMSQLGIEYLSDEFELANQIKSKVLITIDLNEITQLKSPREKISVIVNFINYVSAKYKLTEQNQTVKFAVFALLKSNIPSFKENLLFISLFRHKTIITCEEDYFLSIMNQAVLFIENIGPTSLKINTKEFYLKCEDFDKKEILNSKTGIKKLIKPTKES